MITLLLALAGLCVICYGIYRWILGMNRMK
jgi:hypothetical protein